MAPGTAGSLGGVVLYLLVQWCWPSVASYLVVLLATVCTGLTMLLGRWISERYANEDPGCCVLDEVAGLLVTMSLLPNQPVWAAVALGLVFFRFFDIAKPYPTRWLEKAPYGIGIVLDDVAAGVYAGIGARLVMMLLGLTSL